MLGSINIVAFVPTKDSGKARSFYEGVLDYVLSRMMDLLSFSMPMES
jgi:hypothetical protein